MGNILNKSTVCVYMCTVFAHAFVFCKCMLEEQPCSVDLLGVHFPQHCSSNPLWRGASQLWIKSSCPVAFWMKLILRNWGSELQWTLQTPLTVLLQVKAKHLAVPSELQVWAKSMAWLRFDKAHSEWNNKRLAKLLAKSLKLYMAEYEQLK